MCFVVRPWCHDIEMALQSLVVVVPDVALDHLDKPVLARERPSVVAFPFQDAPETFHRAVVDAVADTGHALRHAVPNELCMERAAGVLEAAVAMEQGMRLGVLRHGFVERIEDEKIVIAVAQLKRHDPAVEKVEDGAQEELMCPLSVRVLEL